MSVNLHPGRLVYGTAADRAAIDTDTIGTGMSFIESDTGYIYWWNGTAWVSWTGGAGVVNTTRVTANYVALVTDSAIFCDTDGGAFTLTLPAGVDGQRFMITNCGSSGNDLTVDGNAAETINGSATMTLIDEDSIIIVFETTEEWRMF